MDTSNVAIPGLLSKRHTAGIRRPRWSQATDSMRFCPTKSAAPDTPVLRPLSGTSRQMVVDRQTNDPQEVENRSGPQTKGSEGEKTDELGRNPTIGRQP